MKIYVSDSNNMTYKIFIYTFEFQLKKNKKYLNIYIYISNKKNEFEFLSIDTKKYLVNSSNLVDFKFYFDTNLIRKLMSLDDDIKNFINIIYPKQEEMKRIINIMYNLVKKELSKFL